MSSLPDPRRYLSGLSRDLSFLPSSSLRCGKEGLGPNPDESEHDPRLVTAIDPPYREHHHWRHYQQFFPDGIRITNLTAPAEQWWSWDGMRVHLDRFARPEAPAKLLALHGPALYGRMLAPYGRLPSTAELEVLAPDLPGSGLTDSGGRAITYGTWVRCVLELIEVERRTDPRPIVLLGISGAGRLAYDVSARADSTVAGVIATCMADPRRSDVRRRIAARPEQGGWAELLRFLPGMVRAPMRWLVNVAAVSNHARLAALLWTDPLGGGTVIPVSLARSFLRAAPVVEPEGYSGPPVLLVHPEKDRWMPMSLSRQFFDRIGAAKRFFPLRGAGHLPVEETGLADLDRAIRDFLEELELC